MFVSSWPDSITLAASNPEKLIKTLARSLKTISELRALINPGSTLQGGGFDDDLIKRVIIYL